MPRVEYNVSAPFFEVETIRSNVSDIIKSNGSDVNKVNASETNESNGCDGQKQIADSIPQGKSRVVLI